MILLDTNVCIRILRRKSETMQFYLRNVGKILLPAMSVAELYYGAERSADPVRGCAVVDDFIDVVPVVQTNNEILQKFGELKAVLAAKGELVGDADTLIAATALMLNIPLATSNVKHFERFPELKICNPDEDDRQD